MDNPRGLLSVTYGQFVDIVKNNPLFFIELKVFQCFPRVALFFYIQADGANAYQAYAIRQV
ncbi:hypothetical protein G6C41_004131 [Salmonella enterica]|nr:hypothetical protein [Salmonella enterica]